MMSVQMIGTINACGKVSLFKNGKLVGYCNGTPNAIAYGMKETGADMAQERFAGEIKTTLRHEVDSNRLKNSGWLSPEKAGFVSQDDINQEYDKEEKRHAVARKKFLKENPNFPHSMTPFKPGELSEESQTFDSRAERLREMPAILNELRQALGRSTLSRNAFTVNGDTYDQWATKET